IRFAVPNDSKVQLVIFDILGRKVRTLVDNILPPGRYKTTWDSRDDYGMRVGSGAYLYRLIADGSSGKSGQGVVMTKKMILMK
ncbi:MAG: FlgD immunoglobulin-like domain containing protein, partial [Bacteroidota bacterium]